MTAFPRTRGPFVAKSGRKPKHKTRGPSLTVQQVRFCRLFAERGVNATQCYVDAGFTAANNNSAGVMAFRLLRLPKIREAVQRMRDDAAEAEQVTLNWLARGFKNGSEADVTVILNDDGGVVSPKDWPEALRKCIVSLEVEELSEVQTDPATGKKRKVAIGLKWKVKLENKTECRKVLAQWKRMIGAEAQAAQGAPPPGLVVKGFNPDEL